VIDPAKWNFYAMDAYRMVGEDNLALTYADEVLRIGTTLTGEERSPMRNAEARVTRGVVAARAGDVDEALEEGRRAFTGPRQSLPTLAMVGRELAGAMTDAAGPSDPRVREFAADLTTASFDQSI